MVLFAFVITVMVFIFSSYVIYTFERRTTIQSVEFKLQLIAGVIEQDMRDLTALSRWCGINDAITAYFIAERGETALSLNAWYRLSEEFYNNRAGFYISRLLIFNHENKRLLQVGNGISSSVPVTSWNVDSVFNTGLSTETAWQKIIADPFYVTRDFPVIPFVCPLYHPNNGSVIGSVFLAASTNLITDKLAGYTLPPGGALYLDLRGSRYCIDLSRTGKDQFVPVPPSIPQVPSSRTTAGASGMDGGVGEALSRHTTVFTVRDDQFKRHTLVSYPIRDGITLTQSSPSPRFFHVEGAWPVLMAALCVLILLLVLSWSGINRMAREITLLMEKQIADEKNKKDLEYRMLQNQITPHFLYNTLNSIKWMAVIQNAGGIAEMTTALSRLLQTVSKDIRKVVPLRDELSLLNDYLIIQKYRYGDSVTLEKKIEDESLLDTLIPRFTLQPLAENAIFHGIEPKGSGTITVKVTGHKNNAGIAETLVSITDDGIGITEDAQGVWMAALAGSERTGMFQDLGIHNVDERIRYAFGEDYGLSIASEEGKYTTVTIRLPRLLPQREASVQSEAPSGKKLPQKETTR
jgi:two-component system sensor histidine kinase YesM